MALGISRTYLGGVVSHNSLINRVASSSTCVVATQRGLYFPTRGYAATANAPLKKKGTATQKGSSKSAFAKAPAAQAATSKAANTQVEQTLEEENAKKLEDIDRILAFQHLMPTIDPWGQPVVETLDVAIPRPITFGLLKSPKNFFTTFKEEFGNSMKNWTSLSLLAGQNAIPGRSTQNLSWWQQALFIFKSFGTQSVKEDALIAPLRHIALDSYVELNNALAQRSTKDINRLTTSKYQEHMLSLLKASKSKNPNGRMIWTLHKTVSPVRIVSLRATEGYMAPNAPRFGHRLMIHALVRFDTEQSLEMYNARGAALHAPATEPQSESTEQVEKWRVPAQRKRVTEYLIIEKRGWTQSPWQFREQMW